MRGVKPSVHVRCVETGQVILLTTLSKQLARLRVASSRVSARAWLVSAVKRGHTAYGFHWERVAGGTNGQG